jgi:hypothetical protein
MPTAVLLGGSAVPAFIAFVAIQPNPALSCIWLAFGYVVLQGLDVLYSRAGVAPDYWLSLRLPLTAVVMACLLIGALYGRSSSSPIPTAPARAIPAPAAGARSSSRARTARGADARAVGRRGADHQQPHGADGRDRRARGAGAAVRDHDRHRFELCATASPAGSTAGSATAGRPPTASR